MSPSVDLQQLQVLSRVGSSQQSMHAHSISTSASLTDYQFAINLILQIRIKCSALGVKKCAFFGDLNVHMPSDIPLVIGSNAYEAWADGVQADRIESIIDI